MPFARAPRLAPRAALLAAASSALTLAVGLAPPSEAQAQVNALSTPCATLQQMVQTQGRVVIHTAPYIYDTYTTTCGLRQRAVPAYLVTRDVRQCFVGFTCAASGGRD